jgi:hypothetical protein
LDLGFQGVYRIHKRLKFFGALSYTDVGNTAFARTSLGSDMTWGMALQYRSRDAVTTLAYDYSHMLDDLDWRKKNHFGLRIQLAWMSLFAGINQIYLTYGLGLHFGILQLMYASYEQSLGPLVNQDPRRDQLLQASLKIAF